MRYIRDKPSHFRNQHVNSNLYGYYLFNFKFWKNVLISSCKPANPQTHLHTTPAQVTRRRHHHNRWLHYRCTLATILPQTIPERTWPPLRPTDTALPCNEKHTAAEHLTQLPPCHINLGHKPVAVLGAPPNINPRLQNVKRIQRIVWVLLLT